MQHSPSNKTKAVESIKLDNAYEKPVGLLTYPIRRRKREFGSAKGLISMAPDFDAPLDDFKEYTG